MTGIRQRSRRDFPTHQDFQKAESIRHANNSKLWVHDQVKRDETNDNQSRAEIEVKKAGSLHHVRDDDSTYQDRAGKIQRIEPNAGKHPIRCAQRDSPHETSKSQTHIFPVELPRVWSKPSSPLTVPQGSTPQQLPARGSSGTPSRSTSAKPHNVDNDGKLYHAGAKTLLRVQQQSDGTANQTEPRILSKGIPSLRYAVNGLTPHPAASEKPYWTPWEEARANRSSTDQLMFEAYGAESHLYNIPKDVAGRKCLSHQVQVGRPVAYAHKVATPQYLDSLEKPYAIFIFHYRSQGLYRVATISGCHTNP